MGRYQDVRELAPSLEASFRKLRMNVEAVKCRLLLAMTLKQCGENTTAIDALEEARTCLGLESDPFLLARLLAELGDLRQLQGEFPLALKVFQEALNLLRDKDTSLAGADLKLYVGGVHRALGSLGEAKDAYREAQHDYAALGMRHLVAYTHLVVAEVLLEMRREREAEWEILAALPAIDEMKMVPEAFAALALLRESVGRRNTNLSALKDLRAQLEAAS
jgi:tetratricopeptide (TPR) repeat protein